MYIFFMDKGQLIQLNETPPSVSSLQTMLSQKLDLKIEKQILLVSGGFLLHPKDRLPINGAGLDKTNPIYVFTRVSNEDDCVKQPDIFQVCDGGYLLKLEQSLTLPSTYDNLTKCSALVELIAPIAQQTRNAVEKLMSEQSQMIQGWNVALANLAEVAAETEKRLSTARIDLDLFENCHAMWQQKFQQISDLKRDLSQVPLLPQLIQQFRCIGDEREGTDSHDSYSAPTNLYEWVCLQSTLSSNSRSSRRGSVVVNTIASRLQVHGLFLGPSDIHPGRTGVRSRTTSVGQLENNTEIAAPFYGLEDYRHSPVPGTIESGARHSFYATGSQPSLNSLLASCATKNTSPSCLSGVGLQSEPIATAILEPDTGWDAYEVDFLTVIRKAQQQLTFLRFGSKDAPESQTEFEGELTYAQRQLLQLHELLTLISTCSNSPARASPSGDSLSDTATEGEQRTCPSTAPQLQCLSPDLIAQSQEALSRSYFSQRLNHVDRLVMSANDMVHVIQEIMRTLLEQCKCGPKGRTLPDFTGDLRTVMSAFRELCNLLDQAMNSKLELAQTLRERQRWLQNIQSQLGKLDLSIQKCVHNCKYVRTMATVVTQLQKAPEVYVRGLVEVARQHEFEHCFVQLSREQQKLGTDEVQRRRVFAEQINENILHSLFSPWIAIKGDRCALTRSHGRGLHSPDFNTIADASDTTGRPMGTNSGHSDHQSSRNGRKTNAYARSSVNSRSEPQLSKLAKTAARLSLRSRQKDTTFMTTSPVLQEVHEDETESRAMEFSPRPRNFSGTNLLMDRWLRVHNRPIPSKEDILRRASYPVEFEGAFPPPRSQWTLEDSDGCSTETTDTNPGSDTAAHSSCITIDDLTKLAQVLPHSLGDYLRQEIIKTNLRRTIPSGSWLDALRPTAEHMGLCPRSVSADRSRNPSQTLQKSSVTSMDAACQVELSLMSPPIVQWPLRSHSASLFLPVNDSPSRPTTITWEPTPSSACSWDLCHVPIHRSFKRSASMSAVAKILTAKTRATQTGGDLDAEGTSAPRSAALSLTSSSYTTPDTLFLSANMTAVTRPDASALQVSQSESECLVNRELNGDSVPERLQSTLNLDEVVGLATVAAATTEHSNGTDAEFATPSTMMSSFHSTRTNLSNAAAGGDSCGWLHTRSIDDMVQHDWDRKRAALKEEDLGATPTARQDQWLRYQQRGRRAESLMQFGGVSEIDDNWSRSDGSSSTEPNCSCQLRSLHARCVKLLEQYTGALLNKLPTGAGGDSNNADDNNNNNEPQADPVQVERLDQLMQLLSSYTADYPPSPCSVHPTARLNIRATSPSSAIPPNNVQTSCNQDRPSAGTRELDDSPTESVTPQTSTTCVQTDPTDLITRATSVTPPPPSPPLSDSDEARNLANQEPERSVSHQTPPSQMVDASGSSSTSCAAPASSVALEPSQSIVRSLPSPLNPGAVMIRLEHCLTFVHANFSLNDTVVFVPVRGSAAHAPKSSSLGARTATEDRKHTEKRQLITSTYPSQTAAFLRAISPASSMLSSTIIQSMDPQTGVTDTDPSQQQRRDLMYTSLDPVVTPATSALVSDLLGTGEDPRSDGAKRSSATTRVGNQGTGAAVTQWRMLSSDGHVYFLHQDDFARLNLDVHVDYCQPSTSAPRGSNHHHHQHRNLTTSVTSLPYSESFAPASTHDLNTAFPPETAINSEPRSCFIVASYRGKERCLSKRVNNRFNLPINFAFYRVRARPLAVTPNMPEQLTDS